MTPGTSSRAPGATGVRYDCPTASTSTKKPQACQLLEYGQKSRPLSSTLKLARKGGQYLPLWQDFNLSRQSPTIVALPESNRWPLPLGGVSGAPTLIQSRCGNKGNFELLTPMASGGLAHYWRNNDDPFVPWFGPIRFGQEAGRFEAVGMI